MEKSQFLKEVDRDNGLLTGDGSGSSERSQSLELPQGLAKYSKTNIAANQKPNM